MTANQSVLTSKKPKEPSKKVNMNELKVVFNRVSIYDPLIFLITNESAFNYSGNPDTDSNAESVSVHFTSAWTANAAWDWIDTQLSKESTLLTPDVLKALTLASIEGGSYETGVLHRDRVTKTADENTLTRLNSLLANYSLPQALKLLGAFELSVDNKINTGNNVTIYLTKITPVNETSLSEYEFIIENYQSCTIKIVYCNLKRQVSYTTHFANDSDEISCEQGIGELDETAEMNELIDDLLCNEDSLFIKA